MKPLSCAVFSLLLFCGVCSAQSIAEQQDAFVIKRLVSLGADIAKPHDIDFFFFFPGGPEARAAAAEIERLGYMIVSVGRHPEESQWQVHATRQMAPELETMTVLTRSFETMASRWGGYYDGWGTIPVK